MTDWKDETTYSRDDTERIPRTWKISFGNVHITVTKHINFGDVWTLHAPALGITRNASLGTADLAQAKRTALKICKQRAFEIRNHMTTMIEWIITTQIRS